MPNVKYFVREGLKGISNNKGTAIGSMVTIFLSMLLIGIFVIASSVVDNVSSAVESQVSITAYLRDGISPEETDAARADIGAIPHVNSVEFTSKEQAMEDFKTTMSGNPQIVDQLDGENPLPASFAIELDDPQEVASVADSIASLETFKAVCDSPEAPSASVKYGQKTVERLFTVTNSVRFGTIALVVLLVFIALVFMNNTIRLSVMNRRHEIGIQKLVGASDGFVRGPFLTEGLLQALAGATLAALCLAGIQFGLLPKVAETLAWMPMGVDAAVYAGMYVSVFVAAALIGIVGSGIAMRKYLEV